MLKLTKIFHFEMAHAIHGYAGACKNIHGHSYELHVTVSPADPESGFIKAPGFLIDFKEIKNLVTENIIKYFDHQMLLSQDFLAVNSSLSALDSLIIFDAEPSAENLLIYISNILKEAMPANTRLTHLKLFETKDSYAEWEDSNLVSC